MKASLVIPRPPVTLPDGQIVNSNAVTVFSLRWTDHHPSSSYGLGILLDARNQPFDGFMFRVIRDALGAWIETDDAPRCAAILGLPKNEPGIVQK